MKNIKFHPEHAWVSVNGHHGTIGISEYAQQQLGEIIYVDLPDINSEIKVGEPLCALESSKVATDVIAPVSGTVIEINESLDDAPQKINSSPYDEGWLIKIILKKSGELDDLMDKAAYEEYIGTI